MADATYVLTSSGTYLVQRPAENQHGFELLDEEQSWPGGFGAPGGGSWEAVSAESVPADVRERLDWLLGES